MIVLDDIVQSFEYRIRRLDKRLSEIDEDGWRIAKRLGGEAEWEDVTEIVRETLAHEIRDAQTIVNRLRTYSPKAIIGRRPSREGASAHIVPFPKPEEY